MPDGLNEASLLAESLRFSGDKPGSKIGEVDDYCFERVHGLISQSGLCISKNLTPGLIAVLEKTSHRLKIPPSATKAYVYASPEVQAQCYSGSRDVCVIRISSGLIELLSEDELMFVIGHEIAHFLLGHGIHDEAHDEFPSKEFFMQQRCQEISVDRLGLVACQSLKTAVRALMKTISGLGDTFLRFDVGSFLNQMRTEKGEKAFADETSTHPSLVMRCRALLWFSMSDVYTAMQGKAGGQRLERTNELIERDLNKYVDGHVREEITEAREDLRLWLGASAVIRDGVFARQEQAVLSDLIGQPTLDKLLGLYSTCNRTEAKSITSERLSKAFAVYQKLAPKEFSKQAPIFIEEVGQLFSQEDFEEYIQGQVGS